MDDFKSPSSVTIGELSRIVKEFEEKIRNGTENPERFLTLTEIEELWGRLIGDTNVLYSDMLQSLIREIDEKELIRQKKGVPGQGNPPADTSQGMQNHLYPPREASAHENDPDPGRSGVGNAALGDDRKEKGGSPG